MSKRSDEVSIGKQAERERGKNGKCEEAMMMMR